MLEVILSLCIALASLQSAIDIREAKNTTINQTVVKQEKQVVKIKTIKSSSYKWETYTITAYRNGKESTGKSKGDKGYGVTASGAITREGITISADTDILPMGTRVYIEGVGERVVQDTGSAIKGHRIDLFMESYSDCMNFGKQKLRVRIIK